MLPSTSAVQVSDLPSGEKVPAAICHLSLVSHSIFFGRDIEQSDIVVPVLLRRK